jgi:predicted AAA+ superfamily ATPase
MLPVPKDSAFLWGCRGTGKSTWLRRILPKALWFDLLDETLYQTLLGNPGLLADRLRTAAPGSWVVLDEIQRLPNLLNEVHRAMEERRLKFVLCGSSARKLKRAGVNLLGGRAGILHMHPFLPDELGKAFDLDEALTHGTIPLVWASDDREARLRAYTQVYLKEEIQAEALVRNLAGFVRFLPVAALFHGQILNVASLARDAGVARPTVDGYLSILEETLLAFRLPAFEARLRTRERSLPKLYWTDPGLVRAAKGQLGPLHQEERGSLFEGFVAQYLRATRDYYGAFDDLAYWAPSRGHELEVDFILSKGNRHVALEVKSGARFQESWCKGLRAVAPLPGLVRRLLVTPSQPPLTTADGIEVIPFQDLVSQVRQGQLFEGLPQS